MDLEEQILPYFLRIFSFIIIIFFLYFYYIFFIKEIELFEGNFFIKKNQTIESIIENNLFETNQFNIFFYKSFLKIANRFYSHIHYGEFFLEENHTFFDLSKKIFKPSNIIKKISIIEGSSKSNLNDILRKNFHEFNELQYFEIIADTYFINNNEPFKQFRKKLINHKNKIKDRYKNHLLLNQFSFEDLIIIGSLIEKEGLNYLDKKNISSVIFNRLNKKMKLQIDATVLYAITDGNYNLGRYLTYEDLKVDHPYNTYKISGLPPEPISYVGLKTIELIFENYKTNYLFYFYNEFEKKHIFSINYLNHKKKLNEYRYKK